MSELKEFIEFMETLGSDCDIRIGYLIEHNPQYKDLKLSAETGIDKAYCLEVELDELVGMIFKAQDLDHLKETTRMNFPEHRAAEDKTEAVDKEDVWIFCVGEDTRPIDLCKEDSIQLELKLNTGKIITVKLGCTAICWSEVAAYRKIVEEKKPEKQTYKLSEMWKVWFTIGEALGVCIFLDEEIAKRRAKEMCGAHRRLRAITRADATEFYEGQNLEREDS